MERCLPRHRFKSGTVGFHGDRSVETAVMLVCKSVLRLYHFLQDGDD